MEDLLKQVDNVYKGTEQDIHINLTVIENTNNTNIE